MLREQPQQLYARVTRAADDACLNHRFPAPETRKPPRGGFRFAEARCFRSTFRELLAPPCLVQADLLSLYLAPVALHQPGRAQRGLQPGIILDQRTRDAVAHRAGLPAFPASIHVYHDVEARQALGELERLAHHHAAGLAPEEFVHRLAVDDELALAGLQKNARHRALAPPGAVVVVADHSCS